MSSFISRHRNLILPLVLWFLSLIVVSVQSYKGSASSPFSQMVAELISSPARAYSYLSQALRRVWKNYIYLVNLRQQNLALQKQLTILELENQMLREQALENERLRRLLEFKNRFALKTIPARVISWDISSFAKTLLINKGKADGIKAGQAVICPKGLVGQIVDEPGRELTNHQATVLLIIDPTSRVSAIVQRSREKGIIQGTGKKELLYFKYLSPEADVKVGDRVITSGLGGIFPAGILIGKLVKLESNPFSVSLLGKVRPQADFNHLEEVLVVVGVGEQ